MNGVYDYFLQVRVNPSLRRYQPGSEAGERWDNALRYWNVQCAPRASCVVTRDRVVNAREAEIFIQTGRMP